MDRIELLSPAGDMEKLKAAVMYGADAVYLAGRNYGLRAFSGNFGRDMLKEGIGFAHAAGVKAYVTVNIFAHPGDFTGLEKYLQDLEDFGADAIIVSDPGILSLIRRTIPSMEIHMSTQSNVTNADSCEFWHRAGAKRIVLARELTLDEIRRIRSQISSEIELEVFVHGAMCVAYSGRCLLSALLTGRDANRGECAQPCRWHYSITEKKHEDDPLELYEDERGSYLLNSKDLCMIEHIPELIEAGISSLKIEGRMRGVFYAATVTKAYREEIDRYYDDPAGYRPDPESYRDLSKTVHREFDTGFFFAGPGTDAKISYDDTYIRGARVAGIVMEYDPVLGRAVIEQRNKINEGDRLEVVSPKGRHFTIKARDMRDIDGIMIDSTPHPRMLYSMAFRIPVVPGSFIRLVEDENSQGKYLQ